MTIDIPNLVQAAGGEIAGKVRLQKLVYLLDQIGLGSGFSYEYHHYGPYSEDLAEQVRDDVIFSRLEEREERRRSDGVPYMVYSVGKRDNDPPVKTSSPAAQLNLALVNMQRHSATVLELAATIHWLAVFERRQDWRTELTIRKGIKTGAGRDLQALDLLRDLGLPPAAGAPAAA